VSSKSTDGTISGLDYAMVVLVIGIVAVSSLYFAWVLLIELYRSVAFYRDVLGERSREKKARKKNITIEPSRVDQETKGTDVEPSMVLHDDDAFHTNPDSVLGNVLRLLKKKTSATVDDDEQRSAAAQRSRIHRTSSGQCSSMYGEEL
jgi:hypothetical protein